MSSTTYNRNYYLENKEKIKASSKKWRTDNKEKVKLLDREARLRNRYGMNSEDYDALYDKQKGYCAICTTHQSLLKRALCVDHCHKTGKIRGLLCDDCNKGLGFFDDNPELIRKAIDYVKKEKNESTPRLY